MFQNKAFCRQQLFIPRTKPWAMPSVTHSASPTLASGKKRRRDDDGEESRPLHRQPCTDSLTATAGYPVNYNNTSMTQFNGSQGIIASINNDRLVFHQASPNRGPPSSLLNMPRKVIALPSKRVRISDENDGAFDDELFSESAHGYGQPVPHDHPHAHPGYSTPPILPHIQPNSTRPAHSRLSSSASLSPCHICHRKPTKKADLDSFASCMGCGQRTCYICIRECHGWLPTSPEGRSQPRPRDDTNAAKGQDISSSFTMHDVGDESGPQPDRLKVGSGGSNGGKCWSGSRHCSMVCSRCCVERGSEGDVVCLGCLAGMEGA